MGNWRQLTCQLPNVKRCIPKAYVLKGILVILVILGHVIPGVLQETFSRYFIYSFHMPLFIAVSGYLVPTQKLNYQSRIDILHKYWYRLIVPWILSLIHI